MSGGNRKTWPEWLRLKYIKLKTMIKKLFARWLRYRIYKAFPGGFGAEIEQCQEVFDRIYPKPLLSWRIYLATLRNGMNINEDLGRWILTGEKEPLAKTDQHQQNHLSREGNILDGPAPRSRE
jgi:hypothetical protein